MNSGCHHFSSDCFQSPEVRGAKTLQTYLQTYVRVDLLYSKSPHLLVRDSNKYPYKVVTAFNGKT